MEDVVQPPMEVVDQPLREVFVQLLTVSLVQSQMEAFEQLLTEIHVQPPMEVVDQPQMEVFVQPLTAVLVQ